MPRRNVNIAANKIVATQVFADTITGSPGVETPAVGTTILSQADSGKTFFCIVGAVSYTVPAIADISAGWNVKFIATGVWTGTITLPAAIGYGETIAAGVTLPASAETTIAGNAILPGDYITLIFDGTSFFISGIGATAAFVALN